MEYSELCSSIDMKVSPQIPRYWRKTYRKVAWFSLVLALVGFYGPLFGDTTVSRLEFCEKIAISCLQRPMSELEILQSGIIDPQPDGKFHLDWPISRGDAARVCQKILSEVPESRTLPGFFSDVELSSPFYAVLAKVGGAFPPLVNDRFGPDVLLTPPDTEHISRVLGKHLPQHPSLIPILPTIADVASGTGHSGESASDTTTWGRQFPMNFRFPGQKDPEPQVGAASSAERISRLARFVPSAQLSPQVGFNLRTAVAGMEELEEHLDSMELSILDLVHSTSETDSQKSQMRDGLTQFRDIISPFLDKLRFSQDELRAVLLTDSESLRLAEQLGSKISLSQRRLNRLLELINEKMKSVQVRK